jgi:multisubunit Na+/H+ antiporter MnhC subunit
MVLNEEQWIKKLREKRIAYGISQGRLAIVVIGIYLGFKREFSKLIGFLVVALVAVGLVFNAGGVKDVLLELFNKIIGA